MNQHHSQHQDPAAVAATQTYEEHETMDTNLLEAQAYTNAVSRLNYPGVGYGFGHYGGGVSTDTNGRAVINANIVHGVDRIVENQKLGFDGLIAQAEANRAIASEFRTLGEFSSLQAQLVAQFNQVDRRFSDMAMANQECCCELKAGQASIIAKIEAQDAIKAAEDRVRADAKLDVLLAKS